MSFVKGLQCRHKLKAAQSGGALVLREVSINVGHVLYLNLPLHSLIRLTKGEV